MFHSTFASAPQVVSTASYAGGSTRILTNGKTTLGVIWKNDKPTTILINHFKGEWPHPANSYSFIDLIGTKDQTHMICTADMDKHKPLERRMAWLSKRSRSGVDISKGEDELLVQDNFLDYVNVAKAVLLQ